MGKSFLFISGKGGVGKSTLASALAITAAKMGKRVAVIDGDIGLRSLDLLLGLQDKVLYDMADLVSRRCRLDQILIWHSDFPSLCLIVGGQQAKPKDFKKQDLQKIIKTLQKRFDYILVDGPAGLGRGMRNFCDLVDEVVVVATPDPVAIRSAEKLASQLYSTGTRPQLLLNRVDVERVLAGELQQPQSLALSLDLPLAGVLEENASVYTALLQGKTAAQAGDEALNKALQDILQRLDGKDCPIPEYKKVRPTTFQRFLNWLKD